MPFKLIRNEDSEESEIFTITTPVPTEMVGLMRKLQEAAGRSYQSVPVSVKGHFKLSKENFNSKDFTTETMFESNEQHGLLYHIANFAKKQVQRYPDKFPEERSLQNLMWKWGELGLSWMNIDILACILPNTETHTVVINAKRFLLHPETHFNQVHEMLTVSCSFENHEVAFFST